MNQSSDPQDTNNNIFEQNEGQPFARRTVSWAFNLGLIVLVMGIFAGWYFSASDEPDGAEDTQMPGNKYDDGSVSSGVYDFFYGIFSGVGDGDSPLQTQAVSDVPSMPLKGSGVSAPQETVAANEDGIIVPSADKETALPQNAGINANDITPETAPSYFNGKIIDYEGKIAGDIKAMIRDDNGERIVYFELDQSLTPADKPRDYRIAYDEVEVAEEDGAGFIRLNKEQTEALAQTLYESDKVKTQSDTQSPEPE